MCRKGILSMGLLLLSCLAARSAEDPALASLKSEIEQLRRERDALESRLRIVQDQLEEARQLAAGSRDGLRQVKGEPPITRVSFDAPVPAAVKPKSVRGKITAIAADHRLMQISIGLDAGVKEGQVLDVFRLASERGKIIPLYLGSLRVTRVDPRTAFGSFERVPGIDRAPKVGDEVANDLSMK